MSPLVQRPRAAAASDQHWSMLVFESLSAGAIAIGLGMLCVLIAVGVYVVLIWPLTFLDFASVGKEEFDVWAQIVLWSVFIGGSLAGFWCFSGAAFKKKPKRAVLYPPRKRR